MIRRRMVGLLVGLLVVGVMLAPASASVSYTLDQLLTGQTIEIGDKVFGNWTPWSIIATDGAGTPNSIQIPDAANVLVTATEKSATVVCLSWQGFIGVGPDDLLDIIWEYDVWQKNGAATIEDMSVNLSGFGTTAAPAKIQLSETLTEMGTNNLLAAGLVTENSPYAESWTPPVAGVHVVKNLGMAGFANGTAHVSEIEQCFSQVPEASSFALFGLGLAGLGLFRRFRKR